MIEARLLPSTLIDLLVRTDAAKAGALKAKLEAKVRALTGAIAPGKGVCCASVRHWTDFCDRSEGNDGWRRVS